MAFLLKQIWLIPVLILILFRDSIFKINQNGVDGRSDIGMGHRSESGATITDDQANELATRLEVSMNSMGTDEEAIWAVFKKFKNKADYDKTHNAFGYRQYDKNFGNVGTPFSPQYNLTDWLNYELSTEDIQRLATDFPFTKIA
ncbi:hypothetical protein [Christiangramia sp. SM2212]|uniref:Uncharacterized protein n=1 Tax=Christiangramia sediminicola TaxID=3073267 RepID=A0ABU1EPE1_9FLAO|nr:hypothetical protein [Christiangramia sp. SM2212]MDR5590255.1 hypothetical protein [Christiangramia sp. SM2212]